jgi:hypothetical protein
MKEKGWKARSMWESLTEEERTELALRTLKVPNAMKQLVRRTEGVQDTETYLGPTPPKLRYICDRCVANSIAASNAESFRTRYITMCRPKDGRKIGYCKNCKRLHDRMTRARAACRQAVKARRSARDCAARALVPGSLDLHSELGKSILP